jgi:hypothetical protein
MAQFRIDANLHDGRAGARASEVHRKVPVAMPSGRNQNSGVHPAAENRNLKPVLVGIVVNPKLLVGYKCRGERAALTRMRLIKDTDHE